MNIIQWMFHYFEIMKFTDKDYKEKKVFLEGMEDLQTSIQAFYLIIDKDKGAKMIDTLIDIKKKRVENNNESSQDTPSSQDSNKDENLPDLLSDEDKELWSFMQTLPETMTPGVGMKEERKPILPTRSKKEILESQTKVVDRIKDEEKPKLGF